MVRINPRTREGSEGERGSSREVGAGVQGGGGGGEGEFQRGRVRGTGRGRGGGRGIAHPLVQPMLRLSSAQPLH